MLTQTLIQQCPQKDKHTFHYATFSPRYKDGPTKDEFPMFESLKLTIDRTLPYWNDVIIPQVCDEMYDQS